MKRLALFAVFSFAGVCSASDEQSWVHDAPRELEVYNAMPELAPSQFIEVPISLAEEVEERLAASSIVEVQRDGLLRLPPECGPSMRAYLVRAVFEHGSNGRFHVYQKNEIMRVLHYALGGWAPRRRSALVVCTGTRPTTLYVSAGGAL